METDLYQKLVTRQWKKRDAAKNMFGNWNKTVDTVPVRRQSSVAAVVLTQLGGNKTMDRLVN